uniref:Uncharacterized protein n=1 Tax=Zosterops lateralis melanops TaxID=1220523 RepID=A0A8D2PFE8_ZOSLA
MASPISQKLEEKLVCSICLELFKVPVTLPCGHNFCKGCISDHWDKQKQAPAGSDASYTCPECRRAFGRCPELEKNVTLYSVVELHGRPLELYCQDERRCICCICTVRDCQRHRRVLFEEERAKKQVSDRAGAVGEQGVLSFPSVMILCWCLPSQTFLQESLEKAQEESERIELEMKELEVQTQSIKVTLQPPCAGLWVGAHWFSWLFLPRTALRIPSMPLLSPDHRSLTFDPETANKYLELSKGARKAKHSPSPVHGQDQGPRFQPWQVLCTQSYGPGHHYWEVKISSHSVILGVTYQGLPRQQQPGHRFNIGLDGGSWGLQVREDCYLAWHKGRAQKIQEQFYKNLGVSLDYSKGLLSFYGLGERTNNFSGFYAAALCTMLLFPIKLYFLTGLTLLLLGDVGPSSTGGGGSWVPLQGPILPLHVPMGPMTNPWNDSWQQSQKVLYLL